eukprot:TRINITY_DN78006_c0_g1_i1.p1 TRINITY_DN78006_c0_g1~~TRINITY_DN78006_c0_g1_i1.p1  ORF type:complete len:443 (-),score=79.09 TRINITY_DN78006_c0_g1_i1:41-1369(-)
MAARDKADACQHTDDTTAGLSSTKRRCIAPVEGETNYSPLVVMKIGTSSLIMSDDTGKRVKLANIAQLIELVAQLKRANYRVLLVSSGAVGMGCIKLRLEKKPTNLRTKQAVAAAGQSQIMRMYEDLFATVNIQVAQLLLSQSDFLEKDHWVNVKHTINECLKLGLVPIINENDCTSTEELRFGDNDNLAALVAVQLRADALFLFTDVDFLYTANPRVDPTAKPLRFVRQPWAIKVDTSAGGSDMGTGGMMTKLLAARTASSAGIPCGLINGQEPQRMLAFLEFDYTDSATDNDPTMPMGTYFMGMDVTQNVSDTRRWILSLPIGGDIVIDDGAAIALANKKSLLPAGIISITGDFMRNEAIRLVYLGQEVARSIANFDACEMNKILGHHSSEFEDLLGFACNPEACHRSNVLLIASADELRGLATQGSGGRVRKNSPVRGD